LNTLEYGRLNIEGSDFAARPYLLRCRHVLTVCCPLLAKFGRQHLLLAPGTNQ
jgi:hypothetical protein